MRAYDGGDFFHESSIERRVLSTFLGLVTSKPAVDGPPFCSLNHRAKMSKNPNPIPP